jgi:hypothetical protein
MGATSPAMATTATERHTAISGQSDVRLFSDKDRLIGGGPCTQGGSTMKWVTRNLISANPGI